MSSFSSCLRASSRALSSVAETWPGITRMSSGLTASKGFGFGAGAGRWMGSARDA